MSAFRYLVVVGLLSSIISRLSADETPGDESPEQEAAERFLLVLEKSPRQGTALDRVYGHHVESGTLDDFVSALRERTTLSPMDGAGWMLLALFEAHRGADADAVAAFMQAEQHRPQDALASYYLGQSLLRIGESEKAIAAMERAIERKPQRSDLLDIFQQLGRLHQRAQQNDQAMEVWQRLESMFPDDPRVLEQIAMTLAEDGRAAEALPRIERLTAITKDDYRRVTFRVAAAELKIKLGQRQAGVGDLEAVLNDLDPDGWLHRDVRQRIDDVFLRTGDQDGLVTYYERWLAVHPDDIDAMARLARFLNASARMPEANQWLEKALALAPSRSDLRRTFISQLLDDQRITEAITQFALLAKAMPGNTDVLRDWGQLVLKDKSVEEYARKQAANDVWMQIVDGRPDDPLTAAQVADLFRQAGLNEQAQQLYERGVSLAPNDPQYREYLGEFHHVQKQSDIALATWAEIATGPRRSAENVARLAEVYNGFGYLDQALATITDACTLDARDFALQMRAADYHARAAKFDESLRFVDAAAALSESDDEREAVIRQRIEILQAANRLDDAIAELAASVQSSASPAIADWMLLARYHEAARRWQEATTAVDSALNLEPNSVSALTTSARIAESSGDFGRAAEISRRLADADRRSRGEHLMTVARLESQLGRTEEALIAARELIVSAPGNTDHYEFLAQLCFRLGRTDDGLDALRKAVRINPHEPQLLMSLANSLADQFRSEEAIEIYWRAFAKTEDITDQTALMQRLTPLYLQIGQFESLLQRLERERQEEALQRSRTICLAQVHHSAQDFGTARRELESLLTADTRDTNLLQQLSKLCEESGDLYAAIAYRRQLIVLAPGHETEFPLVEMLQQAGLKAESRELLVRLTAREPNPVRLIKSLDALLTQNAPESVMSVTEPLLSQQRDDWELLYREGLALTLLDREAEAANRFDRILSLTLPLETLSHEAEAALIAAKQKNQRQEESDDFEPVNEEPPHPMSMIYAASEIRQQCRLEESYRQELLSEWRPSSYGTARMAAMGWMTKFGESAIDGTDDGAQGTQESAAGGNFARISAAANEDASSERDLHDQLFLAAVQNDQARVLNVLAKLARNAGQAEREAYLNAVLSRRESEDYDLFDGGEEAVVQPLSADELDLLVECQRAQLKSPPRDNNADVTTFNGIHYRYIGQRWIRISGGATMLGPVMKELEAANRAEQAAELVNEAIVAATSPSELAGLMLLFIERKESDRIPELFARWADAATKELAASHTGSVRAYRSFGILNESADVIQRWMDELATAEEFDQVLSVLNVSLDVNAAESFARQQWNTSRGGLRGQRQAAMANSWSSYRYGRYSRDNEGVHVRFYSSGEPQDVVVPAPRANVLLSDDSIGILRQAHEIFTRNETPDDLLKLLQARVASSSAEHLSRNQMFFVAGLWWQEQEDEALALLTSIDDTSRDPEFRFELISAAEAREDFVGALRLAESIVPTDQAMLKRREQAIMRLAERIGQRPRAAMAAERLFGMRQDESENMLLMESLRRLGRRDLADAMLARTERQAGNQLAVQVSLMQLNMAQGQRDRARELAQVILTRTRASLGQPSQRRWSGMGYLGSSSHESVEARTSALAVLQQAGELPQMIARREVHWQKAPGSEQLCAELIELYRTAGETAKEEGVLTKAIAARGDSVTLRRRLMHLLIEKEKMPEACDQFLEMLQVDPAKAMEELSSVSDAFQLAKRDEELLKTVTELGAAKMAPAEVAAFAYRQMYRDEPSDAVVDLFLSSMKAAPEYEQYLMRNLNSKLLTSHAGYFKAVVDSVLPDVAERRTNPWAGAASSRQWYSDDAENDFDHLLKSVSEPKQLAAIEAAVAERIAETPTWHSGKVLEAMAKKKLSSHDEARVRLEQLASDEAILATMPADVCWIVGQMLDEYDESRALALKVFERAATTAKANSNSLQYDSPVMKLYQSYVESGRREQARDLLVGQLEAMESAGATSTGGRESSISFRAGIGQLFLELGYPKEAADICHRILCDRALVNSARLGGMLETSNVVKMQLVSMLARSVTELPDVPPIDAVSLLLAVDESGGNQQKLDLVLANESGETWNAADSHGLGSYLLDVNCELGREPRFADAIRQRLTNLAGQYPDDLSIAILRAGFSQRLKDADAADRIRELVALVERSPLEPIAAGRKPNARQRREAESSAAVWLVAERGFDDEQLHAESNVLAARAVEAASRQLESSLAASMLETWSERLLKSGHRDEAALRLRELLKLSTVRPRSATVVDGEVGSGDDGRAGGAPELPSRDVERDDFECDEARDEDALDSRVRGNDEGARGNDEEVRGNDEGARPAPLTITQFNRVMRVAVLASENGLSELSREAVTEAMAGGMPVPENAEDLSSLAIQRSRMFGPSVSAPSTDGESVYESEVTLALIGVVKSWSPKEHDPNLVCDVLQTIVLPSDRPDEVALFCRDSELEDAVSLSLMGELIAWAVRANRLPQLRDEVQRRAMSAAEYSVDANVMLIRLALAAGDHAAAAQSLKSLHEAVLARPAPRELKTACHAALAARDIDELKEDAFALLLLASRTPGAVRAEHGWSQGGYSENRLQRLVADRLMSTGAEQTVRDALDEALTLQQSAIIRSDYEPNRKLRDELNSQAMEAARLGLWDLATDRSGKAADLPEDDSRESWRIESSRDTDAGLLTDSLPLALLVRYCTTLDPDARYRFWRDWTLPTDVRRTVRAQVFDLPLLQVPREFRAAGITSLEFPDTGFVSNLTELIVAAELTGQIDELQVAVDAATTEKLPGAWCLQQLLRLHQTSDDDGAKLLTEWHADAVKRQTSDDKSTEHKDLEVADKIIQRLMLASPKYCHQAMTLRAVSVSAREGVEAGPTTKLLPALREKLGGTLVPGEPLRARHWVSDAGLSGSLDAAVATSWFSTGSEIIQPVGSHAMALRFRYPLSGSFEVSFDRFLERGRSTSFGFGATRLVSGWQGNGNRIVTINGRGIGYGPAPQPANDRTMEAVRIVVRDGKATHFLNGIEVFADEVSANSPWLMVDCHNGFMAIRNLKITGTPVIPREINLLDGDDLSCWTDGPVGRERIERFVDTKSDSRRDEDRWRFGGMDDRTSIWDEVRTAWKVVDDELHGDGSPQQGTLMTRMESLRSTHYLRALAPGDAVRYEFLHESETVTVHPVLGQMVFLFSDDGVKTRWETSRESDESVFGIANDNSIAVGALQSGALPLKANDWNSVELRLLDDNVQVSLNGELVLERPIYKPGGTQFGLHVEPDATCRVRNIVLTGDWPESLNADILADPFAVDDADPQNARLVDALVPLAYRQALVPQVLADVATMEPEQQLTRLLEEVLPPNGFDAFRVTMRIDDRPRAGERAVVSHRARTEFRSPARELVQVAASLNRLADLRLHVEELDARAPVDQRCRLALLAMIELAQRRAAVPVAQFGAGSIVAGSRNATLASAGHQHRTSLQTSDSISRRRPRVGGVAYFGTSDVHVNDAMAELVKSALSARSSADSVSAWTPELLVATVAAEDQEAWPWAVALCSVLRPEPRMENAPASITDLAGILAVIASRAESTGLRLKLTEQEPLTDSTVGQQWIELPLQTSPQHHQASWHRNWRNERGRAVHSPSAAISSFEFQSPLSGSFTVTADRTVALNQSLRLSFGKAKVGESNTGGQNEFERAHAAAQSKRAKDKEAEPDRTIRSRVEHVQLQVDRGRVVTSVDGRETESVRLGSALSPWLKVVAIPPQHGGSLHGLRIEGTPTIRDEVDLIASDLRMDWSADRFGEHAGTRSEYNEVAWFTRGNELLSIPEDADLKVPTESLVSYRRPMLEDGVIEFEAFRAAGLFEVHPALGDSAFLIQPNGVYRHRLTNSELHDDELMPDNSELLSTALDSRVRGNDDVGAIETARSGDLRRTERGNDGGESHVPLKDNDWNRIRLEVAGDVLRISVNGTQVATTEVTEPLEWRHFGLFRYRDKSQARVRNLTYRGEWPKVLPQVLEQRLASFGQSAALSSGDMTVDQLVTDFGGTKSEPWTITGGESAISNSDAGLKLNLIGAADEQAVGVSREQSLKGDFEITLDAEDVKLKSEGDESESRMGVEVQFAGVLQSKLSCEFVATGSGSSGIRASFRSQLPTGELLDARQCLLPSALSAARLRIVRHGAEVFTFVADAESDSWRLIESFVIGDADVQSIAIRSIADGEGSSASAKVNALTIRAK